MFGCFFLGLFLIFFFYFDTRKKMEDELFFQGEYIKKNKINCFLKILVVILIILVVALLIYILIPRDGIPDSQKYHNQFMENVDKIRIGEYMKAYSSFPHIAGKNKLKSDFFFHQMKSKQ